MSTAIKFCGMTREVDVARAAELGAAYVGVIFAGGPRTLTIDEARAILKGAPPGLRRVGVFGDHSAEEIRAVVDALALDVVQLHADPSPDHIARVRGAVDADVWPVLRIAGAVLPPRATEVAAAASAVVLDARISGALGGTGVRLPWTELAGVIDSLRVKPVVLAGGLTPDNVAMAIGTMSPDVVDVSSGVERGPGIKDHERMRAFRDAVAAAGRGGAEERAVAVDAGPAMREGTR